MAAGRLLADPAGHFNHKADLEATASMLAARIKAARQEGKVVNVLELQEELIIAMDAPDNPFVLFTVNAASDIYTNIVKFGVRIQPEAACRPRLHPGGEEGRRAVLDVRSHLRDLRGPPPQVRRACALCSPGLTLLQE